MTRTSRQVTLRSPKKPGLPAAPDRVEHADEPAAQAQRRVAPPEHPVLATGLRATQAHAIRARRAHRSYMLALIAAWAAASRAMGTRNGEQLT